MKIIANNKKALFDYEIAEKWEAGIVLVGDEVKSLRQGNCSLIGSFATLHAGEMYLINCNISTYSKAYLKTEEAATRRRKLLLHRKQIAKLVGLIAQKGVTVVPLKIYFSPKNKVKVELGIGKHKKASDKRQSLREKDIKRETNRTIKGLR
jgi:SsrA-binding protein